MFISRQVVTHMQQTGWTLPLFDDSQTGRQANQVRIEFQADSSRAYKVGTFGTAVSGICALVGTVFPPAYIGTFFFGTAALNKFYSGYSLKNAARTYTAGKEALFYLDKLISNVEKQVRKVSNATPNQMAGLVKSMKTQWEAFRAFPGTLDGILQAEHISDLRIYQIELVGKLRRIELTLAHKDAKTNPEVIEKAKAILTKKLNKLVANQDSLLRRISGDQIAHVCVSGMELSGGL